MSRKELLQTIQDIENGLAMNPTGEILERLTNRLARAQKNLSALDEKKSQSPDPAPKESTPQEFFKKQAQEYRENGRNDLADKVEQEVQNIHLDQTESARAFEPQPERRRIALIPNPEPMTIPVVGIEFKDQKGNVEVRELDQVEIISLLKTYFKRVAMSKAMEEKRYSDAYGSEMGKTVYKLFQGWNTIYKETQEGSTWPQLEDCFPGYGRASLLQKVNAELLLRWARNEKQG
jgi:hypothetical protein